MDIYFPERSRNKYFTKWVQVYLLSSKTGCIHGDPLSPYIFLLYAEVLGQMLRKIINIKAIVINDK